MINADVYSATTTVAGSPVELLPEAGQLILDEGWSPYGKATLTVPTPALAVMAALNPRTNPRVKITAKMVYGAEGDDWNGVALAPSTRTFDLLLRKVRSGIVEATTELSLATDEALLQDWALLAQTPRTPVTPSAVTAIRDAMALAVPGAVLTITADLSKSPTVTRLNLITNPRMASLTGISTDSGAIAALAFYSGFPLVGAGTNVCRFYPVAGSGSATGDSYIGVGGGSGGIRNGVVAGKTYTFSCYYAMTGVHTGTITPNRARRVVVFTKAAGATTYVETMSQQVPNEASAQDRLSVTFTVPVGATECFIRVYHGGSTNAIAQAVYATGMLLEEGTELRPYFDGLTVSRAEVANSWQGTAHASVSQSIVRGFVTTESTVWQPGQTAHDYTAPLLAATRLRLFCDEKRVWRLVDSSYSVPGTVRIAEGLNVTQATVTVDRTDNGDWFDAILLKYTWTDTLGQSRIAYDSASVAGYSKVYVEEIKSPYPGPGAAAYRLARANGRGQVFDLTALSEFSAQPGMEVVATVPGFPINTGYLTAVTWDLADGEMRVSSRALTDTPETAWILAPNVKWTELPPAMTWLSYPN